MGRVEKHAVELVEWLQEQSRVSCTKGFVVGISGGIDSAVVAALCERAKPGQTLGIVMPCHSAPIDADHGYLVARSQGFQCIEVDITKTYDTMVTSLQEVPMKMEPVKMALANIKPRLRMTTLYYYANQLNRLVVGTSNKDERYVGYFTKWGDGAADILPLAHLLKSEVRELAEYLDIPAEIINKPPSAGLWANQTDEDEMGITYHQLDAYLAGEKVDSDVMARIEKMHAASKHKLQLPPSREGK